MTKLKEIVKINSGYASYVNLRQSYFDEDERRTRMELYKPITAHRLAFEKIANSVMQRDKRFYFLTGSYGTGKSHLCLMLSSYFGNQSDLPEMVSFFKNYEDAQKNVKIPPGKNLRDVTGERLDAENLIAKRKEKRFLVALCDWNWNLDFEGTILRALMEALEVENLSNEVDTFYQEAARKLNVLTSKDHLYKPFVDFLSNQYPEWTINKLTDGLDNYDVEALKIFKACHKEATSSDFNPDKANLQLILDDIVKSDKFKETFKGITIIYDEFGYPLDKKSIDLDKLHGFAEYCSKSGMESLPVTFIGTGHKAFVNHGEVGDRVHYNTISARVDEVPLRTEGMEDIISAIVHPIKDSPAWINEVKPNEQLFSRFPADCKRLNIFDWLPAPVLKNNIIINIFPMHPMATYGLLELAKSIGSDNRSVFKFFSPEFEVGEDIWTKSQDFSFPWYVGKTEILKPDNTLNLYTVDLVIDYFTNDVNFDDEDKSVSQKVKSIFSNYEKTLRELNKYLKRTSGELEFDEIDDWIKKILKVMLVHELITNDQVQILNTIENLNFSLNAISPGDIKQIENRISKLTKAGIIYKNTDGDFYEFKKSDSIDVRRLVEDYKSNPDNRPQDVIGTFRSEIWGKKAPLFFEAKDYNVEYKEDKRLKIAFLSAAELEKNNTNKEYPEGASEYFEAVRNITAFGNDYYEGTALIVYCENENQIDRVKQAARLIQNRRVYFGIPKKPIDVSNEIFELEALISIAESADYKNFGTIELGEFRKLEDKCHEKLEGIVEKYTSNKELNWYEEAGTVVTVNSNKPHDIANHCCIQQYISVRNKVAHPDFNLAHLTIGGGAKGRLLADAFDLLSNTGQPIVINKTWGANRGGIAYIKNLFVNKSILYRTGYDGDDEYYQLKEDITGFDQFYPGLSYLLEHLADIELGKPYKYKEIVKPLYTQYGLGSTAISLFLLLAKRHFGDSMVIKAEETSITDLQITKSEEVFNLVNNQYPNAVIIIQEITQEDKDYFTAIYKLFNPSNVEAGKEYELTEAFDSIKSWWDDQEMIVKSDDVHPEKSKYFVKAFKKMDTLGAFAFIKVELLGLFDIEENEKITQKKLEKISSALEDFKKTADDFLTERRKIIIEKINEIFGSKGSTDEHLKDAMKEWSEQLDDGQTDKYNPYQTHETKALLSGLTSLTDISNFFLTVLPEKLAYGALKDWKSDYQPEYLQKIENAKSLIDENKIKVLPPTIKYDGKIASHGKKIEYSENLDISVHLANENVFVYITEDGSDPTKESSNRKKITNDEVINIKGNKNLKIVSIDKDGNYGQVQEINLFDKNEKVKIDGKADMFGDTMINFIFPKNPGELKSSLKSFIDKALKEEIVTEEQLQKIIKDIL